MSENRCNRCNRKLGDPLADYGSTCARILGVRDAYEKSAGETKDDFVHNAHGIMDKLLEMNIDLHSREGLALYSQLFAQEFTQSPQVVNAEDSKGAIEQAIREKNMDHQIQMLSSNSNSRTTAPIQNELPYVEVNFRTTEQSCVKAMEHILTYREDMSQAEKELWLETHLRNLENIEKEFSPENLRNRAYRSIVDIRIEYDRIFSLATYALHAQRTAGPNGEYLPPEVQSKTLATARRAMYNMEYDMVARTIIMEATGAEEDMRAIAQVMVNRYNMTIGKALETGEGIRSNNHLYEVKDTTLDRFDDMLNYLERLDNPAVAHIDPHDVLPGLYLYGSRGDIGYRMYTIGGMLLASSQFTGLTGGNDAALNPHIITLRGSKTKEYQDLAYMLAGNVMEGRDSHDFIKSTGWYSFRGSGMGEVDGNTLTINDSKYINSPNGNEMWIQLVPGGNFYIDY